MNSIGDGSIRAARNTRRRRRGTRRHAGAVPALGVAVLASVVVAACGSSSNSGASNSSSSGSSSSSSASSQSSSSSKPLAGKDVTIVSYTNANPWAAVYNTEINSYLTGLGAKVNLLGATSASQQVQQLQSAVADKPSLIYLEAIDSNAVAPAIAKAKAAGVTIINTDGPAVSSVSSGLHQVLSNNYQLGQYAAQNLVEGFQQEHLKTAKIGVIEGDAAMAVTQDRMKGFYNVLAKYPQYKVASTETNNWDPVQSGQQATQMFAKYGQSGLQGMYGMADYMAVPIVTAAKQASITVGLKDHGLIITGGNCFKVGIDAIKAGEMYGTATEDPGTISLQAAKYGAQLLEGKQVPLVETVQEERVTAANLSQYAAQCSKA